MKNKDVAIHFTKIARDKFQIYNFQTKDNQIANTRDLAAYLTNLRGGMALDNSFYSKLISMPNFSTIAISEDALKIKKSASNGKLEPWKLEKTADGEVFVSAIDEEEDDTILKKSASCHLKHHYVISIKAKNENQKITTYASLKKSACIPETEIELSPINDYVNFDYYSEKNPYDVIQAIVDLLVATGVAVEPSQVECCHDFCDCGMAQVGPVVPCEEDEYILDCYGEEPIVGQSVDSLQSYASAHNKKHFKIYAFDKVVFDSDALKRTAAEETTQKTKYILAGYTDGKAEFVEKEEYATLDGAKNAFDSFKEKAHKKDDFGNELSATEFYIYETKDNGTTHDKTWKITSPIDLLPMQEEVPTEEKTEVEVKEPVLPVEPKPLEEPKKEETEVEIKEPQPLPTGEKKEEIEKKVETPEGQKLEEKVEQTVNASIKNTTKKVAFTYGAGSSDDPGTRNYEVILKEPGFDLPLISSIITKEDLANLLTNLVASQDTDLVKFREFYDELTSVLGKIIDAFPELKKQVKAREYKNFVSEIRNICNWFWHPAHDFIIKPEIQEAVPHEFEPINEGEKVETPEGQKLEEKKEDGLDSEDSDSDDINPESSIKNNLTKKAEINADPKVVLDKLRTGDLLKGTEERKEGLRKVVNDETYKEDIEKLKNDGAITEEEIKEAKDSLDKESKVVKKDDKYQVQSEKGKNLGTYDTKEEAKDRLKEVEMFKHMDKKADGDNSKEAKLSDIHFTPRKDPVKVVEEWKKNSDSPYLTDDAILARLDQGIITRSNKDRFDKAIQRLLDNGRGYQLLSHKIITKQDGELFERLVNEEISKADFEDFAELYTLLEEGILTRENGDLFTRAIDSILKSYYYGPLELLTSNIISKDKGDPIFIKVFNAALKIEDFAFKFLWDKYITREDGDLWVQSIKTITHPDYCYGLLKKGIVTREDGELFERLANYLIDAGLGNYLPEEDNITKEADKVLVDKNTNQPLKPGEDPTNKELVEVEVDKSQTNMTTASNAIYNLFMKSATIEVNKEELSLLTAAYHSPIFKKVAYLGPTAFAFRDQHAIFTVDGNKAVCRKEADLTTVEIKKQEQVNPGSLDSLSDSQLRDYIASLNKKIEVK